jgi:hypothetical protein
MRVRRSPTAGLAYKTDGRLCRFGASQTAMRIRLPLLG